MKKQWPLIRDPLSKMNIEKTNILKRLQVFGEMYSKDKN